MAKAGAEGAGFADVEDTGSRGEETVDAWFGGCVEYCMEQRCWGRRWMRGVRLDGDAEGSTWTKTWEAGGESRGEGLGNEREHLRMRVGEWVVCEKYQDEGLEERRAQREFYLLAHRIDAYCFLACGR